ncbi:hypothetical protein [Neisseria sp.]|uniref:hypothetical protein n=1 Tax=Neisseria sp. TaxID=192066 RepID=UPI0035A1B51D
MQTKNFILPLILLAVLSACGSEEPSAAASEASAVSASAVSEPALMSDLSASDVSASAASAASASAASSPAAAAPAGLGGALTEMSRAKWQRYRCSEKGVVEARYYKTAQGPAAQVRHNGRTFHAPYSAQQSNEDLTAFSNGELTWTISNALQTDFYREADGFLVRNEQQEINGEMTVLGEVLASECAPS